MKSKTVSVYFQVRHAGRWDSNQKRVISCGIQPFAAVYSRYSFFYQPKLRDAPEEHSPREFLCFQYLPYDTRESIPT